MAKKQVILVDASGSMSLSQGGVSRLDHVMGAAFTVLDEAKRNGDELSIVAYGSTGGSRLVADTGMSDEEIKRNVAGLRDSTWGSDLAISIYDVMQDAGKDANLLIVSDGDLTDAPLAKKAVKEVLDGSSKATVDWVVLNARATETPANGIFEETKGRDGRSAIKHVDPADTQAIHEAVVDSARNRDATQGKWQAFVADKSAPRGNER